MRKLRHVSLAARLAIYFAILTASIFVTAGVHLYHSLSEQLQLQDDAILIGSVKLLRHQLELFGSVDAVREDPHRLLDIVLGRQRMLLAVYDQKGDLIAAGAGGDTLFPTDAPIAADSRPDALSIRDWKSGDKNPSRIIAAWGQVGSVSSARVLLVVAYDSVESRDVLGAHFRHVLLTALAGVFAAIILGYIVASRGLRPIRSVAQSAAEITVSRLGERLRMEDAPEELEGMVRSFNHMLDGLDDSFRRLTQFSSDMAHDLRTPINNLMIETQVMLRHPRSIPEYEALLSSNIEEYERLGRMVESMLFLARADNAQVSLCREIVSIKTEICRIAEYFKDFSEEKGVHIDINGDGELAADPILLRRALSNLVLNAIQHSPNGGQVIIVGEERGGDKVAITVSNYGSGILPEHLPRIFDRFYRIDNSRSGSRSSSGLGLAIVKSIVNLHGGDVRVESAPNGVTSFTTILPKGFECCGSSADPL